MGPFWPISKYFLGSLGLIWDLFDPFLSLSGGGGVPGFGPFLWVFLGSEPGLGPFWPIFGSFWGSGPCLGPVLGHLGVWAWPISGSLWGVGSLG